ARHAGDGQTLVTYEPRDLPLRGSGSRATAWHGVSGRAAAALAPARIGASAALQPQRPALHGEL
ncbi:hypothetical protein AB0E81_35420, partial [Streptomyces sp. NPDC033538]|uniref:hypothetical protein n=1 Tax=Streptomyces sp. NPDC033538 TaxID=3155367 RepID=UPI0033E29B26